MTTFNDGRVNIECLHFDFGFFRSFFVFFADFVSSPQFEEDKAEKKKSTCRGHGNQGYILDQRGRVRNPHSAARVQIIVDETSRTNSAGPET